ncbi:hypothetical protein DI09_41p130 [Mitosporidium daphniae]|uniref:Uncharacterized protein n=1 Tax=Mitosporidium daphniae TaxID=1485682 RepID=A0A098VU09_9MICR|nr:uncharacterized protein DI09_41p130 [Mitosporidium daphniae]KGG51201.1 hypothetical protein DI09_41p130 [Mitosporidium daphniae]|eukprot:XP_013237628.1 uncharacterized protein DI09_41p130 [Mitosporidium daphniae]
MDSSILSLHSSLDRLLHTITYTHDWVSEKEIADASERWNSLIETPAKALIDKAKEEIEQLDQENLALSLAVGLGLYN